MSTEKKNTILHGACVAFEEKAVFLRGPEGAGKSDISFRLIELLNAKLVSDGDVEFTRRGGVLYATPTGALHGALEVRGLGLMRCPTIPSATLRLVIDLVPRTDVPTLPAPETVDILGVAVPRLRLHGNDASSPFKIRMALKSLDTPGLLVK
jgi:serine kinase of HPr protein (carbohydrate metabolism regulator)